MVTSNGQGHKWGTLISLQIKTNWYGTCYYSQRKWQSYDKTPVREVTGHPECNSHFIANTRINSENVEKLTLICIQDGQCAYNRISWCVRITTIAVDTQQCILWFPRYLIDGTIFEKTIYWAYNACFDFLYKFFPWNIYLPNNNSVICNEFTYVFI